MRAAISVILPTIVVLFVAAIVGLYWFLANRRDQRSVWRTALGLGLTIGILRGLFASIGWYTVEHTGGPLQVPGFALAMLAWPEAAVFRGRRTSPAPLHFYVRLSLLLIMSTTVLFAVVAAVVTRRRMPDRTVGG
jgi:hypothetical protein